VPTIRHIPSALQQEMSSTLAAAIGRYADDPSDGHLFALLALPKLVLRVCKMRGRYAQDNLTALLRQRLNQYQQGSLRALWYDLRAELEAK
jgi:hypothetical protein